MAKVQNNRVSNIVTFSVECVWKVTRLEYHYLSTISKCVIVYANLSITKQAYCHSKRDFLHTFIGTFDTHFSPLLCTLDSRDGACPTIPRYYRLKMRACDSTPSKIQTVPKNSNSVYIEHWSQAS